MSVNVLEVLYEVDARLADPDVPYDHSDWEYCLCGQVHRVVTGGRTLNPYTETAPEYSEAIKALAVALGMRPFWLGPASHLPDSVHAATVYVSGQAHTEALDERSEARLVVRKAIRALKAHEAREAMLAKPVFEPRPVEASPEREVALV